MAQAFPRADGFNNLPNGVFIPSIFSMKLLARYYEEALVPKVVNFDYEGDIKNFGDNVHIRRDPEAVVRRYYANSTLIQQQINDQEVDMVIDNGSYWNIPIDDVQKFQADVNYQSRVQANAAIQQRRYVDQQVLGSIYGDVAAANSLVNVTVTPNNVPTLVAAFRQKLLEAFAPQQDWWIVIPFWAEKMFTLNPQFVKANEMGDSTSMARSGMIGTMQGFETYSSPNLTTSTGYVQVEFGCKTAVTFASQFIKTETLRNPQTFGDLIRGLQIFGWKTVQPTHLGKQGWVEG